MYDLVNNIISKVKQNNPLILNITNNVTMDFVANGLLSLGASPVMSQEKSDIQDLMKIAHAVVINIGTVDESFAKRCDQTCQLANQLGKPIIFDPVGAGASQYRTQVCKQLLCHYDIAVIRANVSEMMALSGMHSKTNGVDSTMKSHEGFSGAQQLSIQHNVAVCMSGKIDTIVDQAKTIQFERGSALMPQITGTGCLLSAVVAAFHAVHSNRFEASYAASLFYSVCAEIAAQHSEGPGTFKMNFLDCLNTCPPRAAYESTN